jgi:hypothetical protein
MLNKTAVIIDKPMNYGAGFVPSRQMAVVRTDDGLVWLKDEVGPWRKATPEECGDEVKRLQTMLADLRFAFDSVFYPERMK